MFPQLYKVVRILASAADHIFIGDCDPILLPRHPVQHTQVGGTLRNIHPVLQRRPVKDQHPRAQLLRGTQKGTVDHQAILQSSRIACKEIKGLAVGGEGVNRNHLCPRLPAESGQAFQIPVFEFLEGVKKDLDVGDMPFG